MPRSARQIIVDELEAKAKRLWDEGENGESVGVSHAAGTLRVLWDLVTPIGLEWYPDVHERIVRETP